MNKSKKLLLRFRQFIFLKYHISRVGEPVNIIFCKIKSVTIMINYFL